MKSADERAREAWPGIELPMETFSEFLAGKGDPDKLYVADLYLACACAVGIPEALLVFDRDYGAEIERAVVAFGLTTKDVPDVCQNVRKRLLVASGRAPRIATFSGRGTLTAWVRVVATREAARLLRKDRREASDDKLAGALTTANDPELDYLKRHYREEFKRAFAEAVDALADRDRMLLRQHVIDGLSIDKLAAFYRVHRATTARWIEAARESVVTGTRRALTARLKLSPGELESVIRLIRSQLDVSLHTALADRA